MVGSNCRSTYATILSALLSFYAAMQIMISHGAWLARQYSLDAAALGLVALVIGCFDLAASVAVSVFTDRIGKKRSVLIGMCGSLIAYLVLPSLAGGHNGSGRHSCGPHVLRVQYCRLFPPAQRTCTGKAWPGDDPGNCDDHDRFNPRRVYRPLAVFESRGWCFGLDFGRGNCCGAWDSGFVCEGMRNLESNGPVAVKGHGCRILIA